MIDELVDLLPNFPGPANRCRCFLHIVNLIAKSLLKQFDVLRKAADAALNDAECELLELAAEIDIEEMVTVAEKGAGGDNEENDNVDGWVDETASLSAEEREELRENVQPVRLVLVKVSKNLPTWLSCHSCTHSSVNSHLRSSTPPRRSSQLGMHAWRS
jgi:hypothetical protein